MSCVPFAIYAWDKFEDSKLLMAHSYSESCNPCTLYSIIDHWVSRFHVMSFTDIKIVEDDLSVILYCDGKDCNQIEIVPNLNYVFVADDPKSACKQIIEVLKPIFTKSMKHTCARCGKEETVHFDKIWEMNEEILPKNWVSLNYIGEVCPYCYGEYMVLARRLKNKENKIFC